MVLTERSILGTPDEEDWPGVTSLPDYKSTFPQWSATPLRKTVSHMDHHGLDLLAQMLRYDPAQRISGESGRGSITNQIKRVMVLIIVILSETSTVTSLFRADG